MQSFPVATNDAVNNNFVRQQSSKIDEHRLVVKIDEHISDKHVLYGSVFTGGYSDSDNGGLNLLDSSTNSAPTTQIRFTYNYAHSANMVNNVNVGYIRDTGFSGPLQAGTRTCGTGPVWPAGFRLRQSVSADRHWHGAEQHRRGGCFVRCRKSLHCERQSHSGPGRPHLHDGRRSPLAATERGRLARRLITFEPTESALNGTGFAGGQAVTIPAGTGNAAASFLFGGTDFVNISYPIESGYRWVAGPGCSSRTTGE